MSHVHRFSRNEVESAPAVDLQVQAIASRQHGRITVAQLLTTGLSRSAVSRRVQRGLRIPVHRGVYAVGHLAPDRDATRMAAVLASGPGAALALSAAADVRGAWRHAVPNVIDVVAPTRRRAQTGIVTHFSRTLEPSDVELVRGIPTTTIPRTLLDLGDVLSPHQLLHVLHRLQYDHRVDVSMLLEVAERGHGRRAGGALRRAAQLYLDHESAGTRSDLEDRLVALVVRAGLPRPLVNVWVRIGSDGVVLEPRRGRRVKPAGVEELDLFWPDHVLDVEVDGAQHDRRMASRSDRERDEALEAAGVRIIRLRARHIEAAERFGGVPRSITRALRGGGRRGSS